MDEFKEFIEAAQQGDEREIARVLQAHPEFLHRRDELGATALHHAAFGGHCALAKLLVQHGADINARDSRFGATPAGWAIEYLREMGGFLGIELKDFAYAITRGDVEWVARYLHRFPTLRDAKDEDGKSFRELAEQSGHPEITKLFAS